MADSTKKGVDPVRDGVGVKRERSEDLVKSLFGPGAEVTGGEKDGLFGFGRVVQIARNTSVTRTNNPKLTEYAVELGGKLQEASSKGAVTLGQTGLYGSVSSFFKDIYPVYYPQVNIYVKENDEIGPYIPLLFSFKAELDQVNVGQIDNRPKEFDPRSLNSQDLAVLLEEYQQYLDQGKNKEEAEALVARFVGGLDPDQAKKVVRFWLERQEKTAAEIVKTKVSDEKDAMVVANDQLLIEVEIAKHLKVSEGNAQKILDYAKKESENGLISEQDLASAISVVVRQENLKLSQANSTVLQELQEKVNNYITKESLGNIVLQTAKGLTDSKEEKQQKQLAKILEETILSPTTNEELTSKIAAVVGVESAPMLAKKVIVAAEKVVIENQTLVLVGQSGFLEQQAKRELVLMKRSPEFLTKKPEIQRQIWEAAVGVSGTTKRVYETPAARIMELSRIQLGLEKNLETKQALLGVESIVGLAAMPQEKVDTLSERFNKDMRILSRYGIRGLGDRVGALDNAIRATGGEKGKAMLEQIRQRLGKVETLSKLGKIEQLGNLSVSGISKKVLEALGGEQLIKQIVNQLGADGLVKGTQVALGKLSGGVMTKAASWIATRLGVNVAIPGAGTVISIALVAKDVLGFVSGKIKGVLADLGIHIGVKKFVEENFGKVPGFVAGIAEDVVLVLGAAITGISLAFLMPVIVAVFVGLFAYQMFIAINISSLVPPKPATSFVMFDAKKYPGGVIPSSCPSGWPLDHAYMTQGPMTTSSHSGAQAVDLANIAGTPIYATHDGLVKIAGFDPVYFGNYVVLEGECENPDTKQKVDFTTLYGHMYSYPQVSGQVSKGTVLGIVGSTGNSSGPHLHYQLRSMGSILSFLPIVGSLFSRIFGCIGFAACGISF